MLSKFEYTFQDDKCVFCNLKVIFSLICSTKIQNVLYDCMKMISKVFFYCRFGKVEWKQEIY